MEKLKSLFSKKVHAALLYCTCVPLKWVQEILEIVS